MIKFENTEVTGWEAAVRGMRNPMNSWEKSDSSICNLGGPDHCSDCEWVNRGCQGMPEDVATKYIIGPNDLALMNKLRNAGTDHRKFMRMITVYTDITAPLYWWKEADTYRIGVEKNSCSTMHKIAEKEFTIDDFSHEHLIQILSENDFKENEGDWFEIGTDDRVESSDILCLTIEALNVYRNKYIKTKDKKYWWQMIQLLPSSYNQRRTVMLSYEGLANIYKSRQNHKLDEWSIGFIDWIKSLPYSELITGEITEDKK